MLAKDVQSIVAGKFWARGNVLHNAPRLFKYSFTLPHGEREREREEEKGRQTDRHAHTAQRERRGERRREGDR